MAAGIAGCLGGGDGGQASGDIELVARVDGWEGVEPPEIDGETNPTLTLVAGREYVLVWENGDGSVHDIRIVTADDESILNSDDARDEGQRVSVEFTASRAMAAYYSTYRPESMRGDIRIVEPTATETPGYVTERPIFDTNDRMSWPTGTRVTRSKRS